MAVIPNAGEVFYGDDGTVSIVLPDTCDPNVEPTQEELEEYAEWIGIDVDKEPYLMWIAREGLQTPLPEEWRPCRTSDGSVYYFNFLTGDSIWDHPMDDVFKKKVEDEREKFISGGGKSLGNKLKKVKSKSSSSSSDLGAKRRSGNGSGVEKRRLEKGAAGNVESSQEVMKGARTSTVISMPLSSPVSSPTTMGMSISNARFGRLGALGTPEATQRVTPDVSGLLMSCKGDIRTGTRFSSAGLAGGIAGGKLSVTKVPDGVKGLEMNICQRINDEIDARRRAMRLRHQKQIADERAVMESELKKVKEDGEGRIKTEEERYAHGMKDGAETELETARRRFEKQHTEAKARVASLLQTLQREQATMESTLQQRLAEVKEKLHVTHTANMKRHREASIVQLDKEKTRLSSEYATQLEEETKKLARDRKIVVDQFQKTLEVERSKLVRELVLKGETDKKSTENMVTEAQRNYETAIRQATLNATKTMEILRKEYCAKEEKLKALKKDKTEKFHAVKTKLDDTNKANVSKQTEKEEERLRKALEEKTAQFVMETEHILASKQAEVNKLKKQTSSDLKENSNNTTPLVTTTVQREYQFNVASQQLDTRHAEAMDHIRIEHEKILRKQNMFNPRHSDGYKEKVEEQKAAWVKSHPAPTLTMPKLEPVLTFSSSPQSASPMSVQIEEEKRRHIDAAVADAKRNRACEDAQQLADEESTLAKELKVAVEAYRVKRLQEVQLQLMQYREKQAAEHQQRLDSADSTITTEAMILALQQLPPSSVEEKVEDTQLKINEIHTEEANRRQEELRQRLQMRIEILQEALQKARVELRQRQEEILTAATTTTATTAATVVSSSLVSPASWQRPPPVPMVKIPLGNQEQQQLTPRTFKQRQQNGSFTPMLNHTLSTIPSANSLWSSAQPSPTKPFPWMNTINTTPMVTWQEHNTVPLRDTQTQNTTSSHNLQQDLVFEDRLRRAALLLKEKKREICVQRANMERAREIWRQDMKDCRLRRDRGYALMLQEIKIALEAKAEQINREVIDLKRATVWLREREAMYRGILNPQYAHTTPGVDVGLTDCGNVTSSDHIISLLKKILTRTEILKSYVTSPKKTSAKTPNSGRRRSPSNDKRSHQRHGSRHVDVMSLKSNAPPIGVTRWLVEQELQP